MANRVRAEFSSFPNPEIVQLGHQCLELDPNARPTAAEITYKLMTMLKTFAPYDSQMQR